MSVNMFRSTDRGVPSLSGEVGKLGLVLRHAMVEGSAPITLAGGAMVATGDTVTVTHTAHGFRVGQTISVSGVVEPRFRGNFVVTGANANTFTFTALSATSGTATGTIKVGGERLLGTPSSITRSGTVMTVNLVSHGFAVGQRATVYGATQPQYNGRHTIDTVPDANSFTITLPASATPVSPATGTLTVCFGSAALGWTEPYTATNRSTYQQGPKDALVQHVLICDESQTYGNMAAILYMADAATSGTETTGDYYAGVSNTTGMAKSGYADTVSRPWVVIGDGRTVIMLTKPQYTGSTAVRADGWSASYFGDIISYVPSDPTPILCAPCTRTAYNMANPQYFLGSYGGDGATFIGNVGNRGQFYGNTEVNSHPLRMRTNHLGETAYVQPLLSSIMRGMTLSSNSAAWYHPASSNLGQTTYIYDSYPDPRHGGLNVDELHVVHGTTVAATTGYCVLRGKVRGLYQLLHNRVALPLANNDTFDGAGIFAGKKFEVFDFTYSQTNFGSFVVEISDTWGA